MGEVFNARKQNIQVVIFPVLGEFTRIYIPSCENSQAQ